MCNIFPVIAVIGKREILLSIRTKCAQIRIITKNYCAKINTQNVNG